MDQVRSDAPAPGSFAYVADMLYELSVPDATVSVPLDSQRCWKCGGSGLWRAGHIENGRFVGTTGTCFPCRGKGFQTPADKRRTDFYYDHFYQVRS